MATAAIVSLGPKKTTNGEAVAKEVGRRTRKGRVFCGLLLINYVFGIPIHLIGNIEHWQLIKFTELLAILKHTKVMWIGALKHHFDPIVHRIEILLLPHPASASNSFDTGPLTISKVM